MLEPGPALSDDGDDVLRACAVGYVGGRKVDHQQPAIGVDGDVTLGPDDLLARVAPPLAGGGSLDRL